MLLSKNKHSVSFTLTRTKSQAILNTYTAASWSTVISFHTVAFFFSNSLNDILLFLSTSFLLSFPWKEPFPYHLTPHDNNCHDNVFMPFTRFFEGQNMLISSKNRSRTSKVQDPEMIFPNTEYNSMPFSNTNTCNAIYCWNKSDKHRYFNTADKQVFQFVKCLDW